MIPISPITMENITPHIGMPVCAVMTDGARHVGILRGVGDGMLHLDVPSPSMTLASVKGRKTGSAAVKTSKVSRAGHAGNPGFARIQAAKARNVQNAGPKKPMKLQTKAWGYGPYGGWGLGWGFAAAAFGLAALTALFLIPWFWI